MSYGLVFDMDGVLADTEGPIARATIDMFRELYGIEIPPEEFRPYIGTGAVRYTEGPAKKYGLDIDIDEALERRHENFYKIINSGESIALPGAHALINAAAQNGHWRLAIATSSPGEKSRATARAARLPLDKFSAYIHGDLITHKKPHPEIYLKAAEALGLSPADCVAVEDAITGVASAKAAGMACLAVTNSFPADELAEADVVVDSLEDVTLDTLSGLLRA